VKIGQKYRAINGKTKLYIHIAMEKENIIKN